MSSPSSLAGAHCGTHAAVPAVEICSRCGTFLCGECVEYFREVTPACANCLPVLRGSPASTRAKISPVLSTLGLGGLGAGFLVHGRRGLIVWAVSFVFGFAGLAFGAQELRLIRAGQAGTRGRGWARAGLAVGAIFALGFGLLLVSFGYFMVRTYGRAG